MDTHIDKILAVLDTDGGFTTGDVAKRVTPIFGHNKRTHSHAIRSWLCDLQKRGLVKTLDDQKPVCWVKCATPSPEVIKET